MRIAVPPELEGQFTPLSSNGFPPEELRDPPLLYTLHRLAAAFGTVRDDGAKTLKVDALAIEIVVSPTPAELDMDIRSIPRSKEGLYMFGLPRVPRKKEDPSWWGHTVIWDRTVDPARVRAHLEEIEFAE